MFRNVKQIKLAEAEKKIAALKTEEKTIFAELHALKNQLLELEIKYDRLDWAEKNGMREFYARRIPKLKRLFNHKARDDYKKYQNKLGEFKDVTGQLEALEQRIQLVKQQAEETVVRSNIRQRITDAEKEYYKIKNATSLDKLGVTPTQAQAILQEHHLPVTFEQEDHIVAEPLQGIQIKKGLVLPLKNKLETDREQ